MRARRIAIYATVALLLVTAATLMLSAPAALAWWKPLPQLSWYWQLTGTVNNSHPAAAYDIDGFDSSQREVATLHSAKKHVICYIDVGTWENWRPDASMFPGSVLGKQNGWPGERWLDIRQLSVLEPLMTARFQMCKRKGFDAIEPDNIDGYGNDTGFDISAQDQLSYDRWVAKEAHSVGLAVFQKNDPEQATQLQPEFDGVLDEQCNEYSECSSFQTYLRAGKPVLNAEYICHRPSSARLTTARGSWARCTTSTLTAPPTSRAGAVRLVSVSPAAAAVSPARESRSPREP